MKLQLLGYGIVLALGAFGLEWIEYRYLAHAYSIEFVFLVLAVAFLALGIWAGRALMPRRVVVAFEKNVAALAALGITKREYAVLELLAVGQSNKEIARQLDVSPNTIKSHLAHLFDKLNVQRRTQAVAQARKLELIA